MQKSIKNTRPMNGDPYPNSDVELDTWMEQTLQSEMVRGRLLQEQKLLTSECTNSLLSKFPKLANGEIRERRKTPKWNRRLRAKSPIAKNTRMSASTSREDSYRSGRSSRLDGPACSMRISELAVPTKRQCIASWRANANVLPDNMINRLKERVTDQVPIVKVSDAVNCMKQDKRSSHSRDKVVIKSVKRPSRKINREAMNNRIQAEIQALSDAFGMKIAQLLMRPMDITLNSQLQKVSIIISEEIHNVIKNKNIFKTNKATNDRMVKEISEKVTIWITKILEDSKEKLLEEELKVLNTNHTPMITMGRLLTLIEVTTHEESELEEQEGPVLDILDDVLDNILHKCIRTPSENATPEFVSICSSDNDKDETDRHLTDERTSQADKIELKIIVNEDLDRSETSELDTIKVSDEDTIENDSEMSEDTIESDIKKQLHDVIDSFKDDNSEMSKDTIQNDIKQQLNVVIDSLKHDDSDISEDTIGNDIKKQTDEFITSPKHDGSEMSIGKFGDTIQSETYQSNNDENHNKTDVKLEPDINVLYKKETQLPENQNYDDQKISVNEGMRDTLDLNIPNEKENNIPSGIEKNLPPLPSVNEVTGFPIPQNQNTDDKNLDDISLEPDEIKIIDDDVENPTDKNEEQTSNVSDAIEIISDGLSEEKNKKVKFSNENFDPMKEKEQYYVINSRENVHSEDEQLLDNVTNFERPNIDFAPPNDHLLSDADESWPDNAPVTKPSASVTRSISSMGRILESDEKLSIALEEDKKHSPGNASPFRGSPEYHEDDDGEKSPSSTLIPVTDDSQEHKNYEQREVNELQIKQEDFGDLSEVDELVVHEPDEEHSSKQVIEAMQTDGSSFIIQDALELPTSRESENLNLSLADVKENVFDENTSMQNDESVEDSENKIEPETIDTSPLLFVEVLSKWQKYSDIVAGQSDQMHIVSEGISRKFDYRVHPKTAPAWIRRGQGDPCGSPCACNRFHQPDTNKMKDREREIIKLSQDLDFILLKLDKWKNHLNYISKYITTLKHKAALYNVGKNSAAGKHKHQSAGTDKDVSWRKLNQRAKGGPGLVMQKRDNTVKLQISPSSVKYCTTCGRTKLNRVKKQRNRSHPTYFSDTKCKSIIRPECLSRHPQDVSA